MGSENSLIQMRDIVKTFKTPAGEFTALKGIDADFNQGDFVSVVGKSGSGKSTLVNMITGIDRPTSGEVKIGDVYVHQMDESERSRWRGRNLGIVFQFYQLLPMLSLVENVMLPMDFCGTVAPEEREARAMGLLEMVGLAEDARRMPEAVSGGQQQRAAVARALANDPPIIVADEPTGNLDSGAAERVFQLFEGLAARGKTIIMVTHDETLAQRASRRMLLSDGEMISEAVATSLPLLTHEQMLRATKHLETRWFGPGEPIIREGEPNEHFYIVAKGQVEVTLMRPGGVEETIARMGPGEYFGEVTMMQMMQMMQSVQGVQPGRQLDPSASLRTGLSMGLRTGSALGRSIASVKAARWASVEVAALGRRVFAELMAEAHAMREAIRQVVRERLAENAAKGGPARNRLALEGI